VPFGGFLGKPRSRVREPDALVRPILETAYRQDDSPIVMRASMTLSKAPALVGRFAGFSFWATAPLTTISIRSGTFY